MNFDPKATYSGPGCWLMIHICALKAKNKTERKTVSRMITTLAHNFPCEKCREHAKEYMMKHPMEVALETPKVEPDGTDACLFEWTWRFHNAVNQRLGKKIIKYKDAYEFYTKLEHDGCKVGEGCE